MVSREIDWGKLAIELGLESPYGAYCCGSDDALRALELIIGEDTLRASVDYYVEHRPGASFSVWSRIAERYPGFPSS